MGEQSVCDVVVVLIAALVVVVVATNIVSISTYIVYVVCLYTLARY